MSYFYAPAYYRYRMVQNYVNRIISGCEQYCIGRKYISDFCYSGIIRTYRMYLLLIIIIVVFDFTFNRFFLYVLYNT